MANPARDLQPIWRGNVGDSPFGHDHFWQRALSRRQFVGRAAALAGVAAGSTMGLPGIARATAPGPGKPRPIPGGTQIDGLGFFHFYFPTSPNPVGSPDTIESGRGDPSTITDFNGFVGVGEWAGGTGRDQSGRTLYWGGDLRFMDGEYIGLDGRHRQRTFVFV